MKFEPGDEIVCTLSSSCAYTQGNTYKVYLNEKEWKCIKGDDGLEDILSMVISSFRKQTHEDLKEL